MRATSGWSIVPASAGLGRWATLIACALLVTACGDGSSNPVPPTLDGPPRWRAASAPEDMSAIAIQARGPCRIRLRMQSADHRQEVGRWRELAVGQTVKVVWSYQRLPGEQVEDRPFVDDQKSGRTQSLAAMVNCHYQDGPSNNRRLVFWARPDRGRLLHLRALPPGRYEELPREGSVELLTVALVDSAEGEAELKRRDQRTRLVLPATTAEGDRHEIVRFFLDVAPAGTP